MDAWLFPYLMLPRRVHVGPWRLIPVHSLRPRDCLSPEVHVVGRGIAALYETTSDSLSANRFGCLVIRRGERLGATHNRIEMDALRRAVIVGLLDRNPTEKKNQNPSAGAWTSDNATLFGHPVNPGRSLTIEYGALAKMMVAGYRPGRDRAVIRRPVEVHLPLLARDLDSEYATVVFRLLRRKGDYSARLTRAIDWYDLAMRNTGSISPDMRILALHPAFDLLFNPTGSERDKHLIIAATLSKLLDRRSARKVVRHWTKRNGQPTSRPLTKVEWWFVKFTFLRNDVAHGLTVRPRSYGFRGEHHVMVAERTLRAALKAQLVARGYKRLRLDPLDRRIQRGWAKAIKAMRATTDTGA